ncbi:gamma-glutamylcyclotransferase family protein [Novosphingobium mangrovi (ex Hu et al. 2023)]|uniref:Gamma-glutamylcyclotransferase n=1 Tax=Novosphingobium mangrovi (ex Hu et al. 2023) TaxID=2930094 RepID=A0ABT0ADL5_9SPHN|nr:gamma-glutamylcyclotransferase family protein [Novosphingobium mangrovi (ex Hu et al. 2023)]MCJ1961275.1 gamma-glutamylcyclotransferase [Novosphingobium mangrovi (ex Hu et al. 2023)]
MNAPRRFFFYGTLLAGMETALTRRIHAHLRALGPAQVRGRLVAIPDPDGWYPALLPGPGWVAGMLYAARPSFTRATLGELDAYEGCCPRAHGAGEYRRAAIGARLDDGRCRDAQGYLYARPLPRGSLELPGGDFARWLEETGTLPFRQA